MSTQEQVVESNVERKTDFQQVCVWQGTVLGELITPELIREFEDWFLKTFSVRIQYLETIVTGPDKVDHGGRHDIFFGVHSDDVSKFAVPRLSAGIRWVEDVLAPCNYNHPIYPPRVFQYKTW